MMTSTMKASTALMSKEELKNRKLMNTTFAKVKILKSNWVEPDFKVQYTNLKIAEPIKMRINRAYVTFVADVLEELAPVKR